MAEKKITITTAAIYRLMTLITLGLILAACNQIVRNPDTDSAISKTKEITLEPGVETEILNPTLEVTRTITQTSTPESSATPSDTPTPEDTPTPKPTPTPEAITFPSDLVIDEACDLIENVG
jgi:hypothetical protein